MRSLFRHDKERRLAEALAASLDALRDGSATVADCLRRYPDLAAELEPLLQTSERLAVLTQVQPPEATRLAARHAFLDAAAARRRPVPIAPRPVVHRRGWLVFAPVGIAAMLFLAIAVPVLGSMDGGAVPGDWNYAFKRATERVRLALTVDSSDRRLLRIEFAQRRLNEIEKLSNNGRVDGHSRQVAALLKDYTADVNQATAGLPPSAVQQSNNLVDQAKPVLDQLQSVPADASVKSAASDAASATDDLAKNTPPPSNSKGSQANPPRAAKNTASPTPSPTPAPPPTQSPETTPAPTEPAATEPPTTATPPATATAAPSPTPAPLIAANQTPQATPPPPLPTRSGVEVITPVVPTATPAPARTPVPADTATGTQPSTGTGPSGPIASSTRGAALGTQPPADGATAQPPTSTPTTPAPQRTPTLAPPTSVATRAATVVTATLDQVVSAPGQTVYRWNGAAAPLDAVLASLAGSYSVVYYPDAGGQVRAWYPGTPAPTVGPGTLITVVLKPLSGH